MIKSHQTQSPEQVALAFHVRSAKWIALARQPCFALKAFQHNMENGGAIGVSKDIATLLPTRCRADSLQPSVRIRSHRNWGMILTSGRELLRLP